MVAESLVPVINTLGFPIVVSLLMFRQYQKEREHRREERQMWNESLEEQNELLRDLNNRL